MNSNGSQQRKLKKPKDWELGLGILTIKGLDRKGENK
jgi:hypothetical protein